MPRQLLDRLTITDEAIAEQIEIRRENVAGLDEDIGKFERDPECEVVNTRTWATMTGRTAARRLRKIRDRVQTEIDALQAEADRRAGLISDAAS